MSTLGTNPDWVATNTDLVHVVPADDVESGERLATFQQDGVIYAIVLGPADDDEREHECYCGARIPADQTTCGDGYCNDWGRADARGLL